MTHLLTGNAYPFDAMAAEYDAQFTHSAIGRAQRASVWRVMDRVFHSGQRILEINCGTGVDALHLAARGIRVMACDASPEMIAVAERRRDASPHGEEVEFRVLPTEQIREIEGEGMFDGVLSNFAGLNCVADLRCVGRDLAHLVRPGGHAVLCVFGCCCLWEMLVYALRGQAKKAFRRFRRGGVEAQLAAGGSVHVRYPPVRTLRRDFLPYFRLVRWQGVGVAVPPSYLEYWAARFARLFAVAARVDPLLGRCPGVRALADHVVLVFERVEA